jgi:hypothetical protein
MLKYQNLDKEKLCQILYGFNQQPTTNIILNEDRTKQINIIFIIQKNSLNAKINDDNKSKASLFYTISFDGKIYI